MINYSETYTPSLMQREGVFSARMYPRDAFEGLADPVLQIDWFEMSGPTFPPHPHAGFSAVTYLFEDSPNGFINHDSMGTHCQIPPGAMHWSRASRGLVHEEFPIPDGGPVRGLQMFINIPADHQLDPAKAFHVAKKDVELSSGPGWTSRVAAYGRTLEGNSDALPAPVLIEEIQIEEGGTRALNLPAGWGGLMIVMEGAVMVDEGREVNTYEAIAMATDVEAPLTLTGLSAGVRLALILGERTNQPAFQHGPMTLASRDLLKDRVESFNRGEFGTLQTLAS